MLNLTILGFHCFLYPTTRQMRLTSLTLLWFFALSAIASPLNVVFILCDDLGYGDLGCYGDPTIETPRQDRMAAEGQRWTGFAAPASICSPSRAGDRTGRYPILAGCAGEGRRRVFFDDCPDEIPPNEITIAEMLRSAGIKTMCIGKWASRTWAALLADQSGIRSVLRNPLQQRHGRV